jgi:hypothetical protein
MCMYMSIIYMLYTFPFKSERKQTGCLRNRNRIGR